MKSNHPVRAISPATARRLAIARQHLSGERPKPDRQRMLQVIRDLGCLQLDPISAVAKSHLLVLWSRLGNYDPAELDALLWEEKKLFEFWAHCASIVLTEDYPLHRPGLRMSERTRAWVRENQELHNYILNELRKRGPLGSAQFEDPTPSDREPGRWTSGRDVPHMLDYLWDRGIVMVAGRRGQQRLWDLTEHCLPSWTPVNDLSEEEIVSRAAQRSLRALGVGTKKDINEHFTRFRYPGLGQVLARLVSDGVILPVEIRSDEGAAWPGPWYIHQEDISLLDRLEAGEWQPRTTLLSPFDNLICNRARTERLWGFYFRIEIYVPSAKREYGYYVLPILHGERLIGRIDPTMDRKRGVLTINALYLEPDTERTDQTMDAIRCAIEQLGSFLGAKELVWPDLLS